MTAAKVTRDQVAEAATVTHCTSTVAIELVPPIVADLDGGRYQIGAVSVMLHEPADGESLHYAKGWAVPVRADDTPDPDGIVVFRALPAGIATPFIKLAVGYRMATS